MCVLWAQPSQLVLLYTGPCLVIVRRAGAPRHPHGRVVLLHPPAVREAVTDCNGRPVQVRRVQSAPRQVGVLLILRVEHGGGPASRAREGNPGPMRGVGARYTAPVQLQQLLCFN